MEEGDGNDDFCGICADGGDLFCCDGICKRSFHANCLELSEPPPEDPWYCQHCLILSKQVYFVLFVRKKILFYLFYYFFILLLCLFFFFFFKKGFIEK